jgi:hypothetical protein
MEPAPGCRQPSGNGVLPTGGPGRRACHDPARPLMTGRAQVNRPVTIHGRARGDRGRHDRHRHMRGRGKTPPAHPIMRGTLASGSHQPAMVPGLTFQAPEMDLRPAWTGPARQSATAARPRTPDHGTSGTPGPYPGSDASHRTARTRSPSARRATTPRRGRPHRGARPAAGRSPQPAPPSRPARHLGDRCDR